jgi:NADPH:quinone reductase-like Zn-dependent oxidoreductase
MKSKAIRLKSPGGFDNIHLTTEEVEPPIEHQVLVNWRATSLNYHDYLVVKGAIPVTEGRIPMSDGAGEIVAVGDAVTKWKVGDKVLSLFYRDWLNGTPTPQKTTQISGENSDGFLTEYGLESEEALTRMPSHLSFAEAATMSCAALTAWNALMVKGNLQRGESVLIEGTGGLSIFSMQIALAAGAKVYATSSSEEKAERLKSLGVEAVVNYKAEPRWGRKIYELSSGGVDHVIDVGGGTTMNNSIDAAKMGGHVCSIGILGNGRTGEITFSKFFFKHLKMSGIAIGSGEMQYDLVQFMEQHQIKPMVSKVFAFDELAAAFRYQESGQHFGKIVIVY